MAFIVLALVMLVALMVVVVVVVCSSHETPLGPDLICEHSF